MGFILDGTSREALDYAHGRLNSEQLRYDIGHGGRKTLFRELKAKGVPIVAYSRMTPNESIRYLAKLTEAVNERYNTLKSLETVSQESKEDCSGEVVQGELEMPERSPGNPQADLELKLEPENYFT